MASSCAHPPLSEASQLLICRKCHAVKVEGVLRNDSVAGPVYFLDSTPLDMFVDPALVGKRVRIIIEEVIEERDVKMS
jgi:hypothetical protein